MLGKPVPWLSDKELDDIDKEQSELLQLVIADMPKDSSHVLLGLHGFGLKAAWFKV